MNEESNRPSGREGDFLASLTEALSMPGSSSSPFRVVGGRELLFYGINQEDRELWGGMIDYGDDISIQNVIKACKTYLLTHIIGNPNDTMVQLLRQNEAAFGNTMLHNRMINAHDQSVIRLRNSDKERSTLLDGNCKGADYLLRYYELKQTNARTASPEKAIEKRADIVKAIKFRDAQGKTPLLAACKNVNQSFAVRLISLDEKGETINMNDNVENRTPLHIACILGLRDIARALLVHGVDKTLTDKYGHQPLYYLSCSQDEKLTCIREVLDSVNFFAGRYFDQNDARSIYEPRFGSRKLSSVQVGLLMQ